MQAALLTSKASDRKGWLYPLLIIAAVSVILLSVLGAAAIAGWLPRAESATAREGAAPYVDRNDHRGAHAGRTDMRSGLAAGACAECGIVSAIVPVEVKVQAPAIGAATGGVTGSVVGNQVGKDTANGIATVGSAAGGASAASGTEDKQVKKTMRYKVSVRMPDGTYRTTFQSSAPAFAVGDKVRISNGQAAKAG